jgi:hypothetical protein
MKFSHQSMQEILSFDGLDAASAAIKAATTLTDRFGPSAAAQFAKKHGISPKLVALAQSLEQEARSINGFHTGRRHEESEKQFDAFVDQRFGRI